MITQSTRIIYNEYFLKKAGLPAFNLISNARFRSPFCLKSSSIVTHIERRALNLSQKGSF
ncbi:hypothetical protein COC46_16240 [Bacillus sp. AFS041924]|nr:hypothetical protein COC46_16240 [Bacillus sp. AFS041924]